MLPFQTASAFSSGGATTPVEVRRKGLRSMRRLLPRMQLAGYASAVLHPLIRVVDGPTVRALTLDQPFSQMGRLWIVFRRVQAPELRECLGDHACSANLNPVAYCIRMSCGRRRWTQSVA